MIIGITVGSVALVLVVVFTWVFYQHKLKRSIKIIVCQNNDTVNNAENIDI